jgi:hypothetical protein
MRRTLYLYYSNIVVKIVGSFSLRIYLTLIGCFLLNKLIFVVLDERITRYLTREILIIHFSFNTYHN